MPACAGDPYKYPGSDVLRNKAELRDAQALKQFEYEQTYFRAREVRGLPIPQRFDLKHLRALHKHLFQDVYDWAGELRTVEIGKGSSQFASPLYIESEGRRMSAAIAAENNLRGLDKARFVQRLSHHYGDWNALHPFREGNGRVTREFLGQLARGAGYELDQELIENRHGQWNEAARRSMVGELSAIERIFSVAVRPSRAVAFERLTERDALQKFPELAPAYVKLHAVEKALTRRFPNNKDAHQTYLVAARAKLINQLDAGAVPTPARARRKPRTPPGAD